jgi:hypothetical protein
MGIIKFSYDMIRRRRTFVIYICVGVSVMIIRNKLRVSDALGVFLKG